VATVASEFGLAGAYALFLFRRHPELRGSLRFVGPLVLAGALALAVGLVSGLSSVPATIVAAIVYFGVLIALRAIPTEVTDAFAQRLRAMRTH
jgi:ABC-type transport system involved in cytochrome bd biosynthesis fused ATPase/permease subunit